MSQYCDFKVDSEGPADHWTKLAHLPYFKYVQRPEAEKIINGTVNKYIIRSCGDKNEYINGAPNPNLFVISVCLADTENPGIINKQHIKVLRHPILGLRFHTVPSFRHITYFPTLTELIANSNINMISPLI